MPTTDTRAPKVSRSNLDGRRQRRRSRRRRALFTALAALLVVAIAGAAAWWWTADGGEPARSVSAHASTTRASTTTTTAPTTTAPPTTAAPAPTTTPVAVGPLPVGTGPIPVVHRIPTTDPVVFITIDDGVVPDTDALAMIRDHHIPVTLFLNEYVLAKNGGYFKELQDAGAVIGSHTISHANLRGKPADVQHHEICDLVPDFQARFGAVPDIFRPPYGNYDAVTLQQAASCGVKYVMHWSAVYDGGPQINTAEGPLRAGDVILMHFRPGLAVKLYAVLQMVAAAGLHPAQLADYLHAAPPPGTAPVAPTAPVPTIPEPNPIPPA